MGKKAKGKKRDLKKQKGNTRLVWIAVVIFGAIFLGIGGVISYQKAKYAAAPAEIKLIRTLPIYNYESDSLKIVRRSEDYGGYDWKHVYNKAIVHVYFTTDSSGMSHNCTKELSSAIQRQGWVKGGDYTLLGQQKERGQRFSQTHQGARVKLSLEPDDSEGVRCVVRLTE